jgi:tetraacyldisaccharide 4'-kinase
VTTVVDAHHHRSTAVGDEPLLLAREAITVISRRRVAGAEKLVAEGADIILMDDGFQSARLTVDYALIVIDSMRGIGNGWVVPSGPVRAPIGIQMRHLDAILKVGRGDAADQFVRQASRSGKPVLVANVTPSSNKDLHGRPVLAYAGIADPNKFYRTLEELGAVIVDRQDFPDHHHLAEDEISDLLARAEKQGLQLVTTAKDGVRLSGGHGQSAQLQEKSKVVDVDMVFDDPKAPDLIIDRAIEACRRRRLDKKA